MRILALTLAVCLLLGLGVSSCDSPDGNVDFVHSITTIRLSDVKVGDDEFLAEVKLDNAGTIQVVFADGARFQIAAPYDGVLFRSSKGVVEIGVSDLAFGQTAVRGVADTEILSLERRDIVVPSAGAARMLCVLARRSATEFDTTSRLVGESIFFKPKDIVLMIRAEVSVSKSESPIDMWVPMLSSTSPDYAISVAEFDRIWSGSGLGGPC